MRFYPLVAALVAALLVVAALPLRGGRRPVTAPRVAPAARGPVGVAAAPEARPLAVAAAPLRRPAALRFAPLHWRRSRALGLPYRGALVRGVLLPREGRHFATWDGVLHHAGNRPWRRYGTDRLLRTLLGVVDGYAAAHPNAPRIVVGDLSRPHGGHFGAEFGGLGHASHQNGLDVDVYYPRRDGREQPPSRVAQIDRRLSQDLLRRFVRAGVQRVFVGPHTRLTGSPWIVQPLAHHDDHMHVRIRPRP